MNDYRSFFTGLLALVGVGLAASGLILGNSDAGPKSYCGTTWSPNLGMDSSCDPGSSAIMAYLLFGAGLVGILLTLLALAVHRPAVLVDVDDE